MGDQMMGATVLRMQTTKMVALVRDDSLPLSPAARLAWIGFSDEGSPVYMDYNGVVRMLNRAAGSTWWPVANTKKHAKGKSDNYWMVSVSEKQQNIRCIPCKGSRHPPTLPRPALAMLKLEMPLLEMDTEKSQYEEIIMRSKINNSGGTSSEDQSELFTERHKTLIRLFAQAAKNDRDFRSMEVCDLMEDLKYLNLAVAYATKLGRIQLAERIGNLLYKRNELTQEEPQPDDESEDDDAAWDRPGMTAEDEEEEEPEQDEDESKEEPAHTPGPMLKTGIMKERLLSEENKNAGKSESAKKNLKSNPFKMMSPAERGARGTSVFDKMEKTTPKSAPAFSPLPVSIKKSGKKASGGQAKITGFKKTNGVQSKVSKEESQDNLLTQYSSQETSENQPIKKKTSAFDLWLVENKTDLKSQFPDASEEELAQEAIQAFRGLAKDVRQSWVQKAKALNDDSESTKKRKAAADDSDEGSVLKKLKPEESSEKKQPLSQSVNEKLARFAKTD